MIDRKAFWISGTLLVLMLAVAAWRVSLLPDWTHLPRYGENGVALPATGSWVLLIGPGAVLFTLIRGGMRARLADADAEALQPYSRWERLPLASGSIIAALTQGFIIARSFGLLLSNATLFVRGGFIVLGLLTMIISNFLPKLPWLRSRIRFLDLDPDNGARLQRFRGQFGVLFGLVAVLGGLLLPLRLMPPLVFAAAGAGLAIRFWFYASAKRGRLQ